MVRRPPQLHRPPPQRERFLTGGKVLFALMFIGGLLGYVYYAEGHLDFEQIFFGEGGDAAEIHEAAHLITQTMADPDCEHYSTIHQAVVDAIGAMPLDSQESLVKCVSGLGLGGVDDYKDTCAGSWDFSKEFEKQGASVEDLKLDIMECMQESMAKEQLPATVSGASSDDDGGGASGSEQPPRKEQR